MRDIVLVLATLIFTPLAALYPATGALCWAWFSIMNPHRLIYSFAQGQPFNSVIAIATLGGWLLSRERKRWTPGLMPWLLLAWTLWMTINSCFAPFPDWSWVYWDRVIRILVLVFLVFVLATTKARIHGFIWILVISIGYYGVKGGIFTLKSGGSFTVFGPPDSSISDNNHLALAMVMLLPLVHYLRLQTRMALLRFGLAVAMALLVVMVLGSRSRGGMVAMGVILLILWLRTRRKLLFGLIGIAVVAATLNFMPASFWERMNTLNDVGNDDSFQGRVTAWHVATYVALDRFPFGAGFYAPQLSPIFNHYFPGTTTHAAHSIYFQVLGEHGFIGLALFLAILALSLRNASLIIRQCRDRPELTWALDLANNIQIGLLGFYFGGAALSLAYFDGYLLLIALLSSLRELVANTLAAAPRPALPRRPEPAGLDPTPARAPGPPGLAMPLRSPELPTGPTDTGRRGG